MWFELVSCWNYLVHNYNRDTVGTAMLQVCGN